MSKSIPVVSDHDNVKTTYTFEGPGVFVLSAAWPGGRGLYHSDIDGDTPDTFYVEADSSDPPFQAGGFEIEPPTYIPDPDHMNGPFQIDLPACTIKIHITMGSGKTATASYFTFVTND